MLRPHNNPHRGAHAPNTFRDHHHLVFAAILLSALLVTSSSPRDEVPVELLLLDAAGRPLGHELILLDDGQIHAAPAESAFDIEQRGLAFRPALAVVQVGTEVFFPNRDAIAHQVYSFSPGMRFELPLHRSGERPSHRFLQPGIAVIGCNIHDRMQAVLVVAPGPWFGFTDGEGRLRLRVPAGRYRALWFAAEDALLHPLAEVIAPVAETKPLVLRADRRQDEP
jgi:plastocyanin